MCIKRLETIKEISISFFKNAAQLRSHSTFTQLADTTWSDASHLSKQDEPIKCLKAEKLQERKSPDKTQKTHEKNH